MKINVLSIALMFFIFLFSLSFVVLDQANPWKVPAKYDKMENPEDANKASLKIGKSLWNKHCGSCHGKEGFGDGSKSAQLKTSPGDFTSDEFQAQSDGAIFYKTKFGRDEMPNFEKKIPYDEDLWHIVNYMRSFY